MAKTSKPLTVLVTPDLWEHAVVVDLREKGNEIYIDLEDFGGTLEDIDIVLGVNCWRIVPGMEDQQLPLAIKAARKVKYGTKGGDDEIPLT